MYKTFDCLDQKAPLFGRFLLEASAGTGKTYAIEHLVVRLLLEKKENGPLLLEEIVVITFTKAAASDVKERIRSNLEKVYRQLLDAQKDEKKNFPYLAPFLEEEEKKEEAIKRLKKALNSFDSAQIFTIHSFCYRLLKEKGFLAGIFLPVSEEEKEVQTAIKERAVQWLFYEATETKFGKEPMRLLLKRYLTVEEIADLLIKNCEKAALFEEKNKEQEKSFSDLWQEWNLAVESFSKGAFFSQDIRQDFATHFPLYKKLVGVEKEALEIELERLLSMIEEGKSSMEAFENILSTKLCLASYFFDENHKKNKEKKEFICPAFFSWIEQHKKIVEEAIDVKKTLQRLTQEFLLVFETFLQQEDLFTYDTILRRTKEALEKPAFLEAIQKKYKALIVDEFQDTDPLQWKIIEKMTSTPSFHSLFLVGDPKQSIYQFRNADLYTYFQAAEKIGKSSQFHLAKNFRSTPKLVQSLNALFTPAFSLELPKISLKIPYFPVQAAKEDNRDFQDDKKPIHFFVVEDKNKDDAEEIFSSFIAKEIVFLHQERSINYRDIAILVKDRYQLENLRKFLQKKKIPVLAKTQNSIIETLSFTALKEFLEAVFWWKERGLLRKALAGPYMGFSAKEIVDFSVEEEQRIIEKFRSFHDLWQEEGLSGVFRQFWQEVWREKSVLETLVEQEDLTIYRDTQQLIELLLESMSKKPKTKENVLQFFSTTKEQSLEDHEGFFQRYLLGEDGVEIITIHKSKGLEYEIVFAFGVRGKSPELEEDEEKEFEKLRQFYVALTRAKSRVYIPMILENHQIQQDGSSLHRFFIKLQESFQKEETKDLLADLAKQEFFSCCFLEEALDIGKRLFLEKKQTIFPNRKIPHRQDQGRIFSFSGLTKEEENEKGFFPETFFVEKFQQENLQKQKENLLKEEKRDVDESKEGQQELVDILELPKGKELGVVGHAILEKTFRSSLYTLQDEKALERAIQEQIEGTAFHSFSKSLFEKIKGVLSTPLLTKEDKVLGKEGFCLKAIPKDQFFVETEFLYSWNNESFLKGFIDLLFFYEGKYFLVDWKWNFLENLYTQEAMEKVMKENHYFLQAAIYTEAVFRLLKRYKIEGFSEKFGGVFYLFIRGIKDTQQLGVYHFFPDPKILSQASILEKSLCQNFL